MQPLIYNYMAPIEFGEALCRTLDGQPGRYELRRFPDGETYLRLLDNCQGRPVVLLANLHQPDHQFLPIAYFSEALREMGAIRITLAVPYLPYMRQDCRFHEGEAITSRTFARLLSSLVDELITIDPHLHRYQGLDEIYAIPSRVTHADTALAQWVRTHIEQPLIVGPDEESVQWVSLIAEQVGCPVLVLRKTRLGDRDVRIEMPDLEAYRQHTPVLIDDIISTGRTMLETASNLVNAGMSPPYCLGIHGVFAPGAYEEMTAGPVAAVITTNTVPHASNQIRVDDILARAVKATWAKPDNVALEVVEH